MRLPRPFQGTPVAAKSSGQGESPTPKPRRSFESTAIEAACLATSTGWRMASFITNVVKRIRSVTAARAGISTNGSMKGLSSRKLRSPSP